MTQKNNKPSDGRRLDSGEAWVQARRNTARYLSENGLYRPDDERDACGVGFIAAIDGKPRRSVVEMGIKALGAIWHRGAVDADGKTGDGAGIHIQIPQDFFKRHVRRLGYQTGPGKIAVGMVFLPRTDLGAQESCRVIVESEILRMGYKIYGWRQVPVNVDIIGEKANATRPEIEQILFCNTLGKPEQVFEVDLYVIRRRIERAAWRQNLSELFVCSLSCRSVVYKGMFLAEQLTAFYPDLDNDGFISNFALYHQRYSTNTFPTWRLAQPFRVLAHNGEINTVKGNTNWMECHESRMTNEVIGPFVDDIRPVIQKGSSDSAALDAGMELLVRSGRDLPMAKLLMVPQSWQHADPLMDEGQKALLAYCNAVMEPWDGPAAIAAYDGRWVLGGMDRNGFRPMRYTITKDGILIVGSETGMVRLDDSQLHERGNLNPGEMIAVDLEKGNLHYNDDLLANLARRRPFTNWTRRIEYTDNKEARADWDESRQIAGAEELLRRQTMSAWTLEDMELLLDPMIHTAKEATGSMGDDAPLAVLSKQYRGLHHFFRQNFSQVTNPPLDSLRERPVMTLSTRLGNLGNILNESPEQCEIMAMESPILSNGAFRDLRRRLGHKAVELDCTYDPFKGDGTLCRAMGDLQKNAETAVRTGKTHLILSDLNMGPDRAPIPLILASGAVHTHLIRMKLRAFASLHVRTAECLEVHHFAVLIGVGTTTINPYLAQDSLIDRQARGLYGDLSVTEALQRYRTAIDTGLLKVISKMGISVLASYRGGYNFEAVGLSRNLVQQYFPNMVSRVSGMGLPGIRRMVNQQHALAYRQPKTVPLPVGGQFRYRTGGAPHGFDGKLIKILQKACDENSYHDYRRYADGVRKLPAIHLRDLLDFRSDRSPVPIEEVESITSLRRRLVAPGISLGALSPEAHETLSIAMNRIGAKSDSGEGGEDPRRFSPRLNGDNPSSAIKQIASGRFGVTAEYLNHCREIEIKMAQGAKPGEGGQLPGLKVTEMMAKLRHSTPGVTLISPPPHHDIYSIEDLAQLIYDLKQINPDAMVCVKLVAITGIGTIAAGVAKAKADTILISGNGGGTGASPLSSIKHAGLPWEMGLSEVHQVLTLNRLRNNVVLRTDGGIKSGRDIVMAAMLGAEEYGIGTTALIAMGCIMVRQCHSNSCPVGVCTQHDEMRKKFAGTPEKVVNLFTFFAEEVREILASLGFRRLEEVIGRTDLLAQISRGDSYLDDLDLNPLLAKADPGERPMFCTLTERNPVPETLDAQMLEDARLALEGGEKVQLAYNIANTQRTIGARLSSYIVRRFGMTGLKAGHVTIRLRGSAGQSLGAFAVQGLRLEVIGDANDYVGKGLSGGTIIVQLPAASSLVRHENTIIGNTVLYGATSGKLFAAGQAGERFCVRNSGAKTVVEGCGSNGCEYMTGGIAVILGPVGRNFAAGMTGGMAFVYDTENVFHGKINPGSIQWQRLASRHWETVLKGLIREHFAETGSPLADRLLVEWDQESSKFWQVVPKEGLDRLPHPLSDVVTAGDGTKLQRIA